VSVGDERLGGMVLVQLRDAMLDAIVARFPSGPVSAIKHRGEWTDESAKQYAVHTPCIAFAYTGAKDWNDLGDGTRQGQIIFEAFCITQYQVDGDEDDASLALTELLLRVVPGNRWGMPRELVDGAVDVDGLNQYTHKADDKGISIHSVSWVHKVMLPMMTAAEYAALPDFLHLFTRLDPTRGDAEVGDEGDFEPAEHMNEVREPMP
jgi:hypothetical protein